MKQLLSFIFLSVVLCSNFAYAQDNPDSIAVEKSNITTNQLLVTDKTIKREIQDAIVDIYGKENAEQIYDKFIEKVGNSIKYRPKELLEQDKTRKSDWYKDEIIYMFYVDQFGTVHQDKENTFKDTALMLDYLQDLGVTTLYMLPFAESPMKDAGFDVKNPKTVRKDLGGMEEFSVFIKEAKKTRV